MGGRGWVAGDGMAGGGWHGVGWKGEGEGYCSTKLGKQLVETAVESPSYI